MQEFKTKEDMEKYVERKRNTMRKEEFDSIMAAYKVMEPVVAFYSLYYGELKEVERPF